MTETCSPSPQLCPSSFQTRPCLIVASLGLLVLLPTGRLEAQPKLIHESWDAAYLQGARAGFVRTTVTQVNQSGQNLVRGNVELRLNVNRFSDSLQLGMEAGTLETAEGKIVGTHMQQFHGSNKTVDITGQVEGRLLLLTLNGSKPLTPAPWDERALGVTKQRTLLQDKNLKPGDTFSYRKFEPTINLVVTAHVKAKGHEDVEVGGKTRRRALRVETTVEKVENLQLPPTIAWLDESGQIIKSQFEIPGIGVVALYPSTRTAATAPTRSAPAVDVGLHHHIHLSRRILRPHQTKSAVYRVTVKDDDVRSVFVLDSRQKAANVKGATMELVVAASGTGSSQAPPDAEFTQNSYFINSLDPKVKELTRLAVGAEKDPWQKAVRIERWVKSRMVVRNHEALAPAEQVARTLEGDCTEFAMLTAAMCRAAGIPSRTAMGLIYADVRSGPVFAFHMWTEVWVEGGWRGLDATLGQGGIGAGHLKITDQSWHEERSLTPLLPVLRVLGKLSIEVLDVQY